MTASAGISSKVGDEQFRWHKLWSDPTIRIPVLIFFALRIFTFVVALMAMRVGPVQNAFESHTIFAQSMTGRNLSSPLTPLIEPWHRWDTGWYLKIALNGYASDDGSIIFAPLYPVLTKIAGALVGDILLGALIVSNLACLGFLIILYKLIYQQTPSNRTATTSLLLLVSFPTAFYLLAGYTESLFLFFVAGAFFTARKNKWWLAAICAALATLTRIQGCVLIFPLTWIAFIENSHLWEQFKRNIIGENHTSRSLPANLPSPNMEKEHTLIGGKIKFVFRALPRLAAIGAGPLSAVAFWNFLSLAKLGSIDDAYVKYWALEFRPPWSPIIDVIGRITTGTATVTEIAGFIALIIIVMLSIASLRKLPAAYNVYLWPTLGLILLRYYPSTLLNGTMRYVLDFFPIFITAALLTNRYPRLRIGWIVLSSIMLIIFIFLFARWLWVA
jgi:hypothetical protein